MSLLRSGTWLLLVLLCSVGVPMEAQQHAPSVLQLPAVTSSGVAAENVFARKLPGGLIRAGLDRGKGALYGAAIGALVGGVGFAATNYAFTTSIPRDEYTLFSFVLGAAGGGAVGAVLGAIIGAPERDGTRPEQARVHFAPRLAGGGALTVSVSLPSR